MSPEPEHQDQPQLVDVFLRDIHFSRNLAFSLGDRGPAYSIDSGVEVELRGDGETAVVNLHAKLDFHLSEGQTEIPFDLSLVVTGVFAIDGVRATDEDLEGWLTFNGEHLLWPYLRSHVTTVTAASGLPSLTIYTIRIPRPHLGHDISSTVEL